MPHKVKALTNVQLVSMGKILFSGEVIEVEELNAELEKAQRAGIVKITKIKAKPAAKPKAEMPKEAEPESVEEEAVEVPKGMCPVCKEGPFAKPMTHARQKKDKAHEAYIAEIEKEEE